MSKKTFEQQIRLNQRINGIKPSIIVKTEQKVDVTIQTEGEPSKPTDN